MCLFFTLPSLVFLTIVLYVHFYNFEKLLSFTSVSSCIASVGQDFSRLIRLRCFDIQVPVILRELETSILGYLKYITYSIVVLSTSSLHLIGSFDIIMDLDLFVETAMFYI